MNIKLNDYIEYCTNKYYEKIKKNEEYSKAIIFTNKNGKRYSLYNINQYKQNIQYPREVKNEIQSIHEMLYGNIAIFSTITLNPKYNLQINSNTTNTDISKTLKKQKDLFRDFFNYQNILKFKGRRVKKKSVRTLELSQANNIHRNTLDIFRDKNQLENYIRSVILSMRKHTEGRISFVINEYVLKHLQKLFENFSIRSNNRYTPLTLEKLNCSGEYYIKGVGSKEKGNIIKFSLMEHKPNSKLNLIRYMYKNITFQRINNLGSKEHIVFKEIGCRIKQFSKNFFSNEVSKTLLYKRNHKLYRMIKKGSFKVSHLSPSKIEKLSFIYYTANLIKNSILKVVKLSSTLLNTLYLKPPNRNDIFAIRDKLSFVIQKSSIVKLDPKTSLIFSSCSADTTSTNSSL